MPGLGGAEAEEKEQESLEGDPPQEEEEEVGGVWANMQTRLSTFLGRSSWESARMEEAR